MPDDLTTAQAAEYLGVSPARLRMWRSRGRGGPPSYLVGTGARAMAYYKRDDIEAFAASRKEKPRNG